jgi:hypothetical protein
MSHPLSSPLPPVPLHELSVLTNGMLIFILVCCSLKRKRCKPFPTPRAPNKRRNREGIIDELLELDNHSFTRMMRMPPDLFQSLANSIHPLLRTHWTAHSRRMAKVGSGSVVDTQVSLTLLVCLTNLSPFTFHSGYSGSNYSMACWCVCLGRCIYVQNFKQDNARIQMESH